MTTLRTVDPGRALAITGLLGAVAVAGSALCSLGSPRDIALGVAFMMGDFALIRTLVSRLIRPDASKALTLVLLQGKFLMVLLLFAAVMMQWRVAPMSFAFGATLLLVALVVEATLTGRPVAELDERP